MASVLDLNVTKVHGRGVLCLLLSWIASSAALSSDFTVRELCRDIQTQGPASKQPPQEKKKTLSAFDVLNLGLNADEFVDVNAALDIKSQGGERSIPVILFSLGIPGTDARNARAQLNELYIESLPIQRSIIGLNRTGNEALCLRKASEWEVTDESLSRYQKLLSQVEKISKNYLAQSNLEIAERAAKNYPKARVIPIESWKQALQEITLLPAKSHDFVFVFHADPEGRLYDNESGIVQTNFFNRIIEQASSVAIFSCYPEKVRERYYPLAFSKLESAGVQVYLPKLSRDFEGAQKTPLGLLGAFARKHAHALHLPIAP